MANLIHSILPQPRRAVVYVNQDVSITQCVEIMLQHNIGVVVVGDEKNVVGMISERDLVRNFISKSLSPDTTKASDVLCAQVPVLKTSDTVELAMETMTITKRRHILISEDNQIVALLSIGDLVFYLLEDKARVIEQLENYIHTN